MNEQTHPYRARAAARRHLLISGTGRAGTSFLVRYLTALGLDTNLARHGDKAFWDGAANAGLEDLPIPGQHADLPYVMKSPWLGHFSDPLPFPPDVVLDGLILPIRGLAEAAASRCILELRAAHQTTPWLADFDATIDAWGATPGGVVYSLDPLDQARLLAVAFHRLVHAAVLRDVPIVLLAFPRLVEDAEYLHARLAPVLGGRISREQALAAHAQVADRAKVRTEAEIERDGMPAVPSRPLDVPGIEAIDRAAARRELRRLREALAEQNGAIEAARADAEAARAQATAALADARAAAAALAKAMARAAQADAAADAEAEAAAQRADALAKRLEALTASTSWRVTGPLRAIARAVRRIS